MSITLQLSPNMENLTSKDIISAELLGRIQRGGDGSPVVVMTCGMAGSGKTTLAKAIHAQYPHFHRLSIDEINTQNHGIYGVDYAASPSLYDQYMDEADAQYMSTFRNLLKEKRDIILERAFYAKEDRAEYRNLALEAGAKVVLVFLKVERETGKELLWERISKRSGEPKTAANAFEISRDTFERYWAGFEDPVDEDAILIKVV